MQWSDFSNGGFKKKKKVNIRRFSTKISRVIFLQIKCLSLVFMALVRDRLSCTQPAVLLSVPRLASIQAQQLEPSSPTQGWEVPSASISQLLPKTGADFPKPAA